MKVDVLDYTTEGVLFIECENRKWIPVVFLSKSLNETKRNYKIYNKEILVVIRGLKNQRYLLESTRYKFKIWTDHKNLEYFMKVQNLSQRQAYWVLYLSRQFDFTLKYVSGIKMEKIDKLSKQLD